MLKDLKQRMLCLEISRRVYLHKRDFFKPGNLWALTFSFGHSTQLYYHPLFSYPRDLMSIALPLFKSPRDQFFFTNWELMRWERWFNDQGIIPKVGFWVYHTSRNFSLPFFLPAPQFYALFDLSLSKVTIVVLWAYRQHWLGHCIEARNNEIDVCKA